VTTYVGKPSATGQPTRPTQPFIFEVDKLSSKLQSDVCFLTRAAPSGECLRGEGLVWLIGAVVRLLAAALHSSTIGSCQSTATSSDCKAQMVAASPRK